MNDDNWNSVPLAALGSGMYRAPDEVPALTTGLEDYEQRDPNELAMRRMRNSVRPIAGRADITPEHVAKALVYGGGMLVAPELAAGRLAAAGIANAPRAMTALGALGTYLYGTEQPNAEEKKTPAQIKAEQRVLQQQGFYPKDKPIDGVEGEATIAARTLAQQAAEKAQQERDRASADAARAGADTARANADAATAAANSQREANEATRLAQQAEGNERLKEVENKVPMWRKTMREYGPPLGYLVGAAAGAKMRNVARSGSNSWAANRNAKAEALFDDVAEGTSKAALSDRVSKVNQFYRSGGAGERVPFNLTPGSAPGFAVNPGVAPMSSLYGAPTRWNVLTDLAANGLFGAEMTYAHHMGAQAGDELKAAREAINQNPNEANIRRLQAATDNAAWYEFLTNFGRGGAITYTGKTAFQHRDQPQPNMARAERERMDLEEFLRRPPPKPRAPKIESVPENTPTSTTRITPRSRSNGAGESLSDILSPTRPYIPRASLPPDL